MSNSEGKNTDIFSEFWVYIFIVCCKVRIVWYKLTITFFICYKYCVYVFMYVS